MRILAADFDVARIEHAVLPRHGADGYTSRSAPYAIGVAFTGQGSSTVRHDGGRSRTLTFAPGTVGVNGAQPLTWLNTSDPSESVEVIPTAAALSRAAEEHGLVWEELDSYRQHGHDPVIWAACNRFRRSLLTESASAESAEEIVTALLAHLPRLYSARSRPDLSDRHALDAARVRAVTDRVHDAPFQSHPLHTLAASVHLSPFHFLRVFARTVGMTPHAYVTSVRAEHVRRLLSLDGATVVSVAELLDTEPRQLRRLYRRALGHSPRSGIFPPDPTAGLPEG